AFRETIRLRPDLAEVHCNLAQALRDQHRYAEAVAALRHGHELGTRQPGGRHQPAVGLRQYDRLATLDPRPPDLLAGRPPPAGARGRPGPPPRRDSARSCRRKGLPAARPRLPADAFAERPALANDPRNFERYTAACDAAVAAAGQGVDAAGLAEEERGWLRAQ